jgi:dienelactone hydrolase
VYLRVVEHLEERSDEDVHACLRARGGVFFTDAGPVPVDKAFPDAATLRAALRDGRVELARALGLELLGRLDPAAAIPLAIAALNEDADLELQSAAVELLLDSDAPDARRALLDAEQRLFPTRLAPSAPKERPATPAGSTASLHPALPLRSNGHAATPVASAVPLHLGPPTRLTFGSYHPPVGPVHRGAGVVLCNTLGNESLRAFGTLRHIAEELAAAGYAVLRFDYHGTGDSGGSEGDPDRLASWLADIDLAIDELRARSGQKTVGLVGLRLGGTLAMLAAARRDDVASLVAWDPYYDGRDFVTETTRMHKALAMLEPRAYALRRPEGHDLGGVEALGFFLSHATVAELGRVDLLSMQGRPARRVLVVGSAEAQKRKGDSLMHRLQQWNVDAQYQVLPEAMNRNLRVVSADDHARIAADITQWVSRNLAAGNGVSAREKLNECDGRRPTAQGGELPEMDEEPLYFGEGKALFGVVTRPRPVEMGRRKPAIILVNAGPGTRIGPHRQYVRMARACAKLGFLVLRMDLSGSGDSAGVAGAVENDPYPRETIGDVRTAMTMLRERYAASRFVVGGICSGADIAFCAALEDPRVVGAMVMNPRTFMVQNIPDLEQRVRAHHLAATVTATRNWRMLLRGEVGVNGALVRVRQVSRTAAASLEQKVQVLLGRAEPEPVAVDVPARVKRLIARGVDTLLVVGQRDVGIMYVEMFHRQQMLALEQLAGFRRVNLDGIDHLFTLLYAQELLLDTITSHLRRTYDTN